MADDVTVDNGAGTDYDVATDDDGSGNHVQIVKLALSADGSRVPITADASGMLVNLGSNNDVTVTGSVTADTELTTGDLDTGAGTDTRAVVGLVGSASGGGELIPGSATDGLLVNLGANNDVVISDGGNTITVDGTVAVTNAGLTELAAAIDTELQVDVVGALPAGTNNIGDVDILSIAAGDNNIGNVDIASIAAGDNNIGNVDIASIAAGDNNIGNVDVASVVPGTAATNLGKAEDAAHTTGDTGVYVLAVRDDTLGAHSGTDEIGRAHV